ncbi:MAG TPA: N-acetylmuramoyl-L-alanine amidase [Acetobacteraceae bacterium]|nr:N-acetylmuramoyl-L-alanine amidase [Acetobacteraceae bacterium]
MSPDQILSRRVMLGRGIAATFLLPAAAVPSAGALAASDAARRPRQHASRQAPPKPVVMLDAGHGGKDPGAIGVSGTYEKHVALATAHELKRQLEADGHYRVELTRFRDVFIPLEDRVSIAERARATLFVSMHADALSSDHSVRGASVYTLSATASDPVAAALAQTENSADRFGHAHYHALSPEVAQILASLVRRETRIGSVRMAHDVVHALGADVPLLDNPARHAGFVVLKAADIPSVLVEMGFMSNRQDEAALRRPAHRAMVARAMKHAVDAYFASQGHGVLMSG